MSIDAYGARCPHGCANPRYRVNGRATNCWTTRGVAVHLARMHDEPGAHGLSIDRHDAGNVALHTWVPRTLNEKLRRRAKREGKAIADVVRDALRDHVR